MPRIISSGHIVVDQQRLSAAVAAELQLREPDVAELQVFGEKVNMHLRGICQTVDFHQVTCVTALGMNHCTHQASASLVEPGKSGGILPSVRALVTEGTAH